ncbi:GntR family transcriptional regulator [Microbacterium aoyamense]|uniref:GntR family transcriptional regulator n=1 Tax=Microbacterium aoyamense TaxID=344166 RepID=A0ABN2PHU4_9MICO|nr:GntR family transcriptional regulator [Microbacterium aoyamense]
MATPLVPLNPHGTVLGDEVYRALGEAILDGTLPPGERLRDQEMAERLGVSRTPVREALQRLERIGLVEVSPHRYTRVSVVNDKLARDTTEFVALTVGNCMRIAVDRGEDAALDLAVDHLSAVIDASRADDNLALLEASALFFQYVVYATDNVAFHTVLAEAEMAIRRNLSRWHPYIECSITRTGQYERMRDAIVARDGRLAESLMREIHGFA